jgi:16S rRNA processing protein RimM
VGSVVMPEGTTRRLTVASAGPVADGPGWWLSFREARSRTAAESLRDAFLEIEVDRGRDLAPGEAYWHEVVGVDVVARDGAALGRVADVYRAGETEVYVVRGGQAGEFDLPAVQGIVVEFAPREGRIVVDEAALDLGGPAVDAAPQRDHKPHRWSRHGKGGAGASDRSADRSAEPRADDGAQP